MTVHARSEHPRGLWATRRLAARARAYLTALGRTGDELSILVVRDATIRRLNRRWRGVDRPTDVLSFPHAEPPGGPWLGDVVISLDTAMRRAGSRRAAAAEIDRYLAHGLLHLLGHDHHRAAEARRMAEAEDALVGEGLVTKARSAARQAGARPGRRR
jgi:probable rRNA maturation factor